MELNRSEPVQAWRCEDLLVDARRRVVQRGGRACTLGARAFDLLVALLERHDRVVSKHELIELVWPDSVVEENNLQVHISTLRKLVGAHAIVTVPGRGYRFTGALHAASAADALAWHFQSQSRPMALPVRPTFCVFVATSLDGFIAREDGSVDWLEQAQARVPDGEDCGYAAFMRGVDLLVMGRHTFEQALARPRWPYGDKPVHVLSTSLHHLPPGMPAGVTLSDEEPAALAVRVQEQGLARRVCVDGDRTVKWFLREGLVDEFVVTALPVLLGRGRPLFGPLDHEVMLSHVATRSWPFGFVQSTYRRA